MIVDSHIHSPWLDPQSRPENKTRLMIDAARRNGINKIIILSRSGCGRGAAREADVFSGNSITMREMDEFKGMVYGCYALNPAHAVSFLREEIDR